MSREFVVPPLEGYLTVPDVADRLGVTKQAVHKMIYEGRFKTVRQVGNAAVYVVKLSEVEKTVASRAKLKDERAGRRLEKALKGYANDTSAD